MGDLTEWLN